jgi:hypothetical protein
MANNIGPTSWQRRGGPETRNERNRHAEGTKRSIEEITEALSVRLVAQWEGWKNQDPAPRAILADDFHPFWPDRLRPRRKAYGTADVRAAQCWDPY